MKNINLKPNRELAYMLGLILGDGSLYHNKKQIITILVWKVQA